MIQSVERETGDDSVSFLQFGVGSMKSEQGRCIFTQNWALRHSVTLWTASLCRNQSAASPTRETSDSNPPTRSRMIEERETETCCVSTDENERVSWFIVRFTGLDPAAVADYSWFYAFMHLVVTEISNDYSCILFFLQISMQILVEWWAKQNTRKPDLHLSMHCQIYF